MVKSGTVLAGRYQLDRQLGAGAMSEVWQARDLEYGRKLGVPFDVAVKVVHSTLRTEELKRFEQEAEILRDLRHPNIVRLHDTDVHEGQLFIVMELLEGQDLGKLLEREGRLPVRRAVELMRQAAAGLSAVHAAGIVHRDLKPANLFVRPGKAGRSRDLLKIGDFGFARVSGKRTVTTEQGVIVGTWAYIAPERWLGTWHGEPGVDLYSLGCVLYELLAGKTPFPADSMAVIEMHEREIPRPLRSAGQAIPAPLNDLVLRLLEKDPRQRYESAAAVADALSRIRDDLTP
jgi:serine/threonine protein kinase